MGATREKLFWGLLALVLSALAVPWFLWGNDTAVAGLPLWLWWHIGWMLLTAAVFYAFTRVAWGIGVDGGVRDG